MAISDSLTAIEGEASWIVDNVTLSSKETSLYLSYHEDGRWPIEWALANVLNGLTPDGQAWDIAYERGYIWYSGTL